MNTSRFALLAIIATLVSMSSTAIASESAGRARLVHPNPFTDGCTFTLTMPAAGRVKIIVYDMLGRQVRDVTAQNQRWEYDAGVHEVRWDGKDETGNAVSAGTYICVLWSDAGEVINSVKVVKAGGNAIN